MVKEFDFLYYNVACDALFFLEGNWLHISYQVIELNYCVPDYQSPPNSKADGSIALYYSMWEKGVHECIDPAL